MKRILRMGLLIIVAVLSYLIYVNYPKLNIITGFAAKNVCSCVFEAGRELETIETGDNNFAPVSYAENTINLEERYITSKVLGLKKRKAVYEEGIGCTLLPEDFNRKDLFINRPYREQGNGNLPYPFGNGSPLDSIFSGINYQKLEAAVDNAFDAEGENLKQTRAVVVLYKDHLIYEKYGSGFNKDTKLLGWSMTKSITNAVLGVLEKQRKISLDQDNLFKIWEEDERSKITINNLLQMNSGLEWEEDYSTISDVTKMLFLAEDMPRVQLHKPMVGEPGKTWNYSSGTSNLLSEFIRNQFGSHQEYLDFWYSDFIDKIGMHSMTLEADASGNYVGSSYSWATARDWAKFGLLYLHRGNWNGEQVLNEDWVEYSATPTSGSDGQYGAHFWLNAGGIYPNVPRDLFSSNGFQGQHVFIIPSKDIVIARFGLAEHPEFNVDRFLSEVLEAIGEE